MRLIPKIFLFNEEELVPELCAQRLLNKGRIPEITRYIVNNRDNYTFSAITASDGARLTKLALLYSANSALLARLEDTPVKERQALAAAL